MALSLSLFTGFSGLRNHQGMLDIVGNNIANVSTLGFKRSRILFSDALNQFVRSGSRPTDSNGGTNPFQVGLGVKVSSIDRNWTQGSLINTGITTDLALQGPGLFILKSNGNNLYTRAGSFQFDANGQLVSSQNGAIVQGKIAVDGLIPSGNNLEDIIIDTNMKIPAVATTEVNWGGNLESDSVLTRTEEVIQKGNIDSDLPGPFLVNSTIYNDFGDSYDFVLTYTKTANPNEYDLAWEVFDSSNPPVSVGSGSISPIQFEDDGNRNFVMDAASIALFDGVNNRVNLVNENLDFVFDSTTSTQNTSATTLSISADEDREPNIVSGSINVFDSLGNSHLVTVKFTKIGDNQWLYVASVPGSSTASGNEESLTGTILFNSDGSISPGNITPSDPHLTFDPKGGADTLNVGLNFGTDFDGLTQTSSDSKILALSQDGAASAVLNDIQIDQYGNINGIFSNGTSRTLAQLMVANFANVQSLSSVGENMFSAQPNSGDVIISTLGAESGTVVQSGALEQSNVDLSAEFIEMIIAQRGFQANARVITTADTILQETINLVR
ncbi:MAG: flagellar hook protein FlgE [Bacteroidetes bacterium]|nr:flagellar hook protein FlgE [Bacteroidota bacterium]MCH8033252.1 flagellar hook protein FlgE [Bacteroidota bacterium]